MNKEWKVVAWLGVLLFIYFLRALVDGSKEDARQIIDILLYGYVAFAGLSIIDGAYKLFKKQKQDILK
jgi:hypothetical protein